MSRSSRLTRFAPLALFSLLVLALALTACGGSSSPTTTPPASSATVPNAFVGSVPGHEVAIGAAPTRETSWRSTCCSSTTGARRRR